jgi:hypothetical protein
VDEPDFSAVVSARLDPILAPRGFPYAARENGVSAPGEPAAHNPDSVICPSTASPRRTRADLSMSQSVTPTPRA